MVLKTLFATLLATVVVRAAPFSQRRDLSTVVSQCHHDFAYTWDDGPYLYHQEIVSNFNAVGGKTTFFMNGDNWSCIYDESNVKNMRAAFESGHMAASHTWSHADLTTLSHAQIDVEIKRLDEAFVKILGVRPKFLRPPYGSINDAAATYIQQTHGKTIVMWSDDSGDSTGGSAQDSYNFYKAIADAGPGKSHLTLSHETEPSGIGALRMGTVPLLANAGIKLQTVAQCLDMEPYEYVGGYGIRDSSWYCGGSWTPSPTSTTRTTSSSTKTTSSSTKTTSSSTKTTSSSTKATSSSTKAISSSTKTTSSSTKTTSSSTRATTTTSATTTPSCVTTYYSASGDTCVSIGSKYGLTGTSISQSNTFINCSDIWTGTAVCIPPPGTPCGQSYSSVAGDSCATVASKFGVTAAQISLWNSWVNCSDVWTGTVLCVKH